MNRSNCDGRENTLGRSGGGPVGFSSWVLAVVNDAVDSGGRDGAVWDVGGALAAGSSTAPEDPSTMLSSLPNVSC